MESMKILKIKELNVNTGRTWRICGKVIKKSGIMSYFTANSDDGRRFTIDVSDSTGIIRIVAFGDEVDKFYSKIEINGLYIISGGQIKISNIQFNELEHDCEIRLNKTTTVEKYELSTSSSHHDKDSAVANAINALNVTQLEIESILKENEEDRKLISKKLADLNDIDEQNKTERQMLDSKLRRLTYERHYLLNRRSL